MREIKFRAWDKRNNCWVNNFTVSHDGLIFTLEPDELGNKLEWQHKSGEFLELMQYIGLKDKNGKEIYEGDVLDCIAPEQFKRDSGKFEVVWCEDDAQFQAPNYLNVLWYRSIEIIGNIYQNPKLLNK